MKLRALQREVAHICGWTDMISKPETKGLLFGRHISIPASHAFGTEGFPVPNFPEDYNAMHVAETMLKPDERDLYASAIALMVDDPNPVWAVRHAPPAVLAAAFLSVIKQRVSSENGHILTSPLNA